MFLSCCYSANLWIMCQSVLTMCWYSVNLSIMCQSFEIFFKPKWFCVGVGGVRVCVWGVCVCVCVCVGVCKCCQLWRYVCGGWVCVCVCSGPLEISCQHCCTKLEYKRVEKQMKPSLTLGAHHMNWKELCNFCGYFIGCPILVPLIDRHVCT